MVSLWLSTLASVGMAVGPPLVYLDQTVSIIKKKYALSLAARILYSL
jgi:solute carrier family 66, member 2